ncbi:MAG: ABC transporter ATP-binding protein [Myxococcales bacterium]|nr:ABC transporter ATP-binding protein [Myxococcales bacterium]HRC58516.1 ABC transporter ATP-binding protein [Kofleriaceae bacterium]
MPLVSVDRVVVDLGAKRILSEVSASAEPGQLVAIVGPNGAGKTTLLRAIAGLCPVSSGAVRTSGVDPWTSPRKIVARSLAYVPQHYRLAFSFSVEEVVLLGRFAAQHGLGWPSEADRAAATAAMDACDVAALAQRRFDELSAGEARRVVIAQALCQGASCLLLDEPTAAFDPAHARALFAMLKERCAAGLLAIVVTHDLDLALRTASSMWLVAGGTIAERGAPQDVLAARRTQEAFGIGFHLGVLPSGAPFAVPR